MRKEATEIIFMEFAYGLKRVGGLESNCPHAAMCDSAVAL